MDIELWNGATKAVIDPQGAYITNLSDDLGDILYPKRMLTLPDGTEKIRGGCHVCLPNFGPGGTSGQPQHGFGREMTWDVTQQTTDSVTVTLAHGKGNYADLSSVLTYKLGDQSLTISLEVTNNGPGDLRIAPGFHPYFSTMQDKDDLVINGERHRTDEFGEAIFITGSTQTLETLPRSFILKSEQLSTWAMWTDRQAPYFCIEPTLGGFTFLNKTPLDDEILHSGQAKTFSMLITWT